jgi:hypothetical protein
MLPWPASTYSSVSGSALAPAGLATCAGPLLAAGLLKRPSAAAPLGGALRAAAAAAGGGGGGGGVF